MAALAVEHHVAPGEREAGELMGAGHGGAVDEAPGRVAAGAVRPHLAAVHVAVAAGALGGALQKSRLP